MMKFQRTWRFDQSSARDMEQFSGSGCKAAMLKDSMMS